ncbi:hypothetical protein [uncultured Marinobacter sp.]|uniref:hypothetical protein n=1 Tax=uncultured Marinobacter sp. TaxID=187379 RepID=UPI0030DA15F5|tara:strand:+ start:101 stop:352 length:252 start_codon:yes stop_codon:yes gene_type:complete
MSEYHDFYIATLARNSTVPTLMCGHCGSMLSRAKIVANEGQNRYDLDCEMIGQCSGDDCGAINCCDNALELAELQNYENRVAV